MDQGEWGGRNEKHRAEGRALSLLPLSLPELLSSSVLLFIPCLTVFLFLPYHATTYVWNNSNSRWQCLCEHEGMHNARQTWQKGRNIVCMRQTCFLPVIQYVAGEHSDRQWNLVTFLLGANRAVGVALFYTSSIKLVVEPAGFQWWNFPACVVDGYNPTPTHIITKLCAFEHFPSQRHSFYLPASGHYQDNSGDVNPNMDDRRRQADRLRQGQPNLV